MSYQALLFCPDEKTARTVTQVLTELDFSVTPCTEPFAAVKKLMGEHFDAVVVDCDNEQNATLLFKSARNAPNNQSALAVAVVEAQAGVAKAFRIGANLVLTKPINVEQAKGTLRVARGLLRKGEAVKTGATATSPAVKPADATPFVKAAAASGLGLASGAAPKSAQPIFIASVATESSENEFAARAESAPTPISEAAAPKFTSKTQATPAAWTGAGAASAPAPAREPGFIESTPGTSKVSDFEARKLEPIAPKSSKPESKSERAVSLGEKATSIASEPAIPVETAAGEVEAIPNPATTASVSASAEAVPAGGGNKKTLISVAAVVLLAAAGYAGWMQWQRMGHATAPAPVVAPPAKSVSSAVTPQVAPDNAPAPASAVPAPVQGSVAVSAPSARPVEGIPVSRAAKPSANDLDTTPAVTVVENKVPAKQPIVIKGGTLKNDISRSAVDPSATAVTPPSVPTINPSASGALPNLIGGSSKMPTPVLATVISQGASQELLIKKVPPVYPANALRIRMEGAVQLLATISKKGDVSSVKIVKGNDLLGHAAVEAVKQWKYKPYLLNGNPVECQTPITVDFKLPN